MFDNEVASLRELIGNLEDEDKASKVLVQSGINTTRVVQLSSVEITKIKELLEKFPSMEELMQKLLTDMKNMNL